MGEKVKIIQEQRVRRQNGGSGQQQVRGSEARSVAACVAPEGQAGMKTETSEGGLTDLLESEPGKK